MPAQLAPRDRLIDTAAKLFYDRGLPGTGINEITDRAEVARMTLYNNFASKEALALAAFEKLAELRRTLFKKHLERAQTALDRIKAMFNAGEDLASEPRFRGCAFINLAAQELEPKGKLHAIVREHKAWIKAVFLENAKEAGYERPELAAEQLLALWDGSIMEAFIQGNAGPIHACREAACFLLLARA